MKHSYIWSAFSFTLLGSASVNAEAHDANEKKEAERPNIIFIFFISSHPTFYIPSSVSSN